MNIKFVLPCLLAIIACLTVNGQSIYRIKYKSPDKKDTITYDAFFVRYDNGGGFVRVSYTYPVSKKKGMIEMEIQEQYALDKNGMTDTSNLLYEGMNPKLIAGDSKIKFVPVTFWFKTDTAYNYEFQGVTNSPTSPAPGKNNFLSSEFIKSTDLTKDLVLLFFTPKDQFYNNLFGNKSKGGMLTIEERKTKLFLVVISSTKDSSLGISCINDGRKTVETFSDVADFLGIKKVIDTIYGDRYNKTSVVDAINKIQPDSNDIIVFYYSGHGFTDPLKKDKIYPFLDLRDPLIRPKPKPTTQTLNIQDIYDTISKKGARFNLVISDCCNTEVITKKTTATPPPKPKGSGMKWNFDNVKTLFMNKERLSLLMTAATKGEEALSQDAFGSFFTHYFLSSLTTYLGPEKGNANWLMVMADAQKQTIFKAGTAKLRQTPKMMLPK
jgi:hypothetical protein